MYPHEKIAELRKELHLSKVELAKLAGVSLNDYLDIELHSDEIFSVTPIKDIKIICSILNINLLDLFDVSCVFCNENKTYKEEYSEPRNNLITIKMGEMNISKLELGDHIGFYEVEIDSLERNPEHLESWSLDLIKALSTLIDVPIQILLKVKCKKCGR